MSKQEKKRNNKKRILMLLSNPFKPDPRVYNEAKSLVEEGYNVIILAWDREGKYPLIENVGGITVYRVKCKGDYGKPKIFLKGILCFYIKSLQKIKEIEFNVVHAHDFDTLPLAIIISKKRKSKLVYDIHDDYASMISEVVPQIVSSFIDILHKILVKFADYIILANRALGEILGVKGTVVMNCADVDRYNEISQEDVLNLRKRLRIPEKAFVIVYIGILRNYNFLKSLIDVAKNIDNCYLIVGGDGPCKEKILNYIKSCERVKYVGWVKAQMIPYYTKLADAIVVLNNPYKRYDRISTPVKMFEAMAAGIPVIVSKGGEAEKIVQKEKCGVAVDYYYLDDLSKIIKILMADNNLKEKLGLNGKKAAERYYNLRKQLENLKKIYKDILAI